MMPHELAAATPPPTHTNKRQNKALSFQSLPSSLRYKASPLLPGAQSALMDRKGTDAEGGRGGGRGRRLAVLVVVQNALVLACLLLSLYNCWYKEPPQPEKIVHIQVESFKVLTENQTLRFSHVKSKHRMRLGEQSDTIHIKCTGPYVWYMDVCYQATEGRGILQLQVERLGTPVSSVVLDATHGAASTEFCRGLHSLVYFRAKQVAQVHLSSNTGIIFRNVTMGLTYLLGNMCDY